MTMIAAKTPQGKEFSGSPKKLTIERIWAFSGGPFRGQGWPSKNIHTDYDFAKETGLSTVYVSATQYLGHLAEHLIDLFGEKWLCTGRTRNLKFIKAVTEGDTLRAKSKVKSIENDGRDIRCVLDVWCENQSNEKVLVGEAIGLLG
jgi:acyl dehydratase